MNLLITGLCIVALAFTLTIAVLKLLEYRRKNSSLQDTIGMLNTQLTTATLQAIHRNQNLDCMYTVDGENIDLTYVCSKIDNIYIFDTRLRDRARAEGAIAVQYEGDGRWRLYKPDRRLKHYRSTEA